MKIKKVFSTAVLLAALAGVTAGCSNPFTENKDLKEQVSTYEENEVGYKEMIASLNTSVANKELKIQELEASKADLESTIEEKEALIAEHVAKGTADATTIASLEAELETSKSELDSVNTELTAEKETVAELQEQIETLQATVDGLSTEYTFVIPETKPEIFTAYDRDNFFGQFNIVDNENNSIPTSFGYEEKAMYSDGIITSYFTYTIAPSIEKEYNGSIVNTPTHNDKIEFTGVITGYEYTGETVFEFDEDNNQVNFTFDRSKLNLSTKESVEIWGEDLQVRNPQVIEFTSIGKLEENEWLYDSNSFYEGWGEDEKNITVSADRFMIGDAYFKIRVQFELYNADGSKWGDVSQHLYIPFEIVDNEANPQKEIGTNVLNAYRTVVGSERYVLWIYDPNSSTVKTIGGEEKSVTEVTLSTGYDVIENDNITLVSMDTETREYVVRVNDSYDLAFQVDTSVLSNMQ